MTGEDALARAQKISPDATKFIVRLFDGFDHEWMDVTEPQEPEAAMIDWERHTEGGTKCTSYSDIDYYAIFPADIKMIFSEQGRKDME